MAESQLDRIERKIGEIHLTLNGPPGESQKGLVVRVDRVEQKQRLVWLAVFGAVVAVVKTFWANLMGK
jgi:hypothetical protein